MMPTYAYTALTDAGKPISGEKVAVSSDAVQQELAQQGLLVQQVRKKSLDFAAFFKRRIKPVNFMLFNHEFIALIRAGLTVPDALVLAADRPDEPELAAVLTEVLQDVRGGLAMSAACAKHPGVFDPLYLSTLQTGEKTGALHEALLHYQEYLKHKVMMQKKVSQALAYPIFLMIVLVVMLTIMFTVVIPRFVQMYADFDAKLPWATQLLIDIMDTLPYTGPVILVVVAALLIGWRLWRQTEQGALWIDKAKERLPYFGEIHRLYAVSHLSRSLSALLSGGTPLVEAMTTAKTALSSRLHSNRMAKVIEQVQGGESLAKALAQQTMMPSTAIKMVEVGEASGSLDQMLSDVSLFYEEILDTRLSRVLSLVEPLLMILMGVMVGAIVIIMYLPIFNMVDVVR